MVPAVLPLAHDTADVRVDGRPTPALREELRRIASWRNAGSVLSLYLQTAALIWITVRWMWALPVTFVLMGRAFAQFASLMHEAAHRLLFADKRINDWVGRWMLGYPAFTSTDAYRRVHMAHHRDEFGPDEPDMALYAGYPIGPASFRRKVIRDATGRTGLKLMRQLLDNVRSPDSPVAANRLEDPRRAGPAARCGNRLWPLVAVSRAVAGAVPHGVAGDQPAPLDRRTRWDAAVEGSAPDHTSVRQHLLARFILVPYNIGWHLAHHVDSGVPFRNLPRLHQALGEAGYVDPSFEYESYPAIWRALRS